MARLRAISGPLAGQTFDVENELVIGRQGDVTINDSELSRRHAVVRRHSNRLQVEDLGSSNGTFVDGNRIDEPTLLGGGAEIKLGNSVFVVEGVLPQSADQETVLTDAGPGATRVGSRPPTPPAEEPVAAGAGATARHAGPTGPPPAPPQSPAGAPSEFQPPARARRRGLATRSWVPVVLSFGTVIATAIALVIYFSQHQTSSSSSTAGHGATSAGPGSAVDTAALDAAGANAAFQTAEVSPPIDKVNTACVSDNNGQAGAGHFRFITSACENSTSTVATLPLHRGTSGGQTVYYVITDDSNQASASRLGVNFVPKLRNVIGSKNVMKVTMNRNGTINFPATVHFGLKKVLVPGPNGFPPAQASPSAMGAPTYSPLIELPNGEVMNAPQIANNTGTAIKVVKLDTSNMRVLYVETEGRYDSKHVHYMSFDSSSPVAATIENMTYAPGLVGVPRLGDEGMNSSSRETLTAFTNGATGVHDPERQGLSSTILDQLDPHNILHEVPQLPGHQDVGAIDYAPMWDVHLVQWTPTAINGGDRVELRGLFEVDQYLSGGAFAAMQAGQAGSQGLVQGAGGKVLTMANFIQSGASGFVVNCPPVSIDLP